MVDNSIEGKSTTSQQTFANFVSQLAGEEFAIKGLEALVNKENYKNVGLVPQIQEDKAMNKISIRFYNNREVRAIWSDNDSRWFYSATDIVCAINNESDYVKAGNYWRWLKKKLAAQGIQPVSDTHKFKLVGPDGKKRVADVLDDNGVMLLAKHYPNN